MSTDTGTSTPRMPGSEGLDLSAFAPRVFVTGGAGFIGSHVVRRLLELGLEVTTLVLPKDPAPLLDGLDVRLLRGDLSDVDVLARGMEGCRLVIHLAAIYALWLPDPKRIYEVNVDGTRNVMQAAQRAGVRRVVHTSSIAAVGCLPGRTLADETTGFNDWDIADGYVLSKYISEQEALRFDGHGIEVVAANPSFPFGPHDIGPTPTGRLILAVMKGQLPFVVDGGLNAVDVRDVAEGHLLAAARGRPGERYILGGHNVVNSEFYGEAAELIGVRPPRLRVPPQLVRLVGSASDLVTERVLRRPPMLTRKSVDYTVGRYLWFSVDKARRELGYEPTPLRTAVADSVAWFRQHGNGR